MRIMNVERLFGRNSKRVGHGDEATQLSDMVNERGHFVQASADKL